MACAEGQTKKKKINEEKQQEDRKVEKAKRMEGGQKRKEGIKE